MDSINQVVSWQSQQGTFTIESNGMGARFILPSGEFLELDLEVWRELHKVLPSVLALQIKTTQSPATKKARLPKEGLPNAGKPWSTDDDEALCEIWKTSQNLTKIAERFGRTRGAIQARLEHLNLID